MKITYIKMLKDKKEAKEKNVLMKHLREKEGHRPKKTFTNSQKTLEIGLDFHYSNKAIWPDRQAA